MLRLFLVALLFVGAAVATPNTEYEYENAPFSYTVGFELSWQNADNIFALTVGRAGPPLADCHPDETQTADCGIATTVFKVSETDIAIPTESEYEPMNTEVAVPAEKQEPAQEESIAEPEAEAEAEAHENGEEEADQAVAEICRSVIVAVDNSCQANVCSEDCHAAAGQAVAMLPLCGAQPLGVAYSSCGVHTQTFEKELEIVARTHNCECAGECAPTKDEETKTENGHIANPYCEDALLNDMRAHRISRAAVAFTFLLYVMLWLSIWCRYVRCVEQRFAQAGRPMGCCHKFVFRVLALPLTACLTQFMLCMMAMMPMLAFIMLLTFIIIVRRRRRRRMIEQALAAQDPPSTTEVVMVEIAQPSAVCVTAKEHDCEVVDGEVVKEDEEVVMAVPQPDEVVEGEVLEADGNEVVVADVVA